MNRNLFISIIIVLILFSLFLIGSYVTSGQMSGAPPFGEPEESAPTGSILPWYSNWKRPDGPAKVALQVGHWKSEEHPEELKKLRGNTGARGGGKMEWEVNYSVAQLVKEQLGVYEITVEILPATVPPRYWADVFISIHADGSEDTSKSGFKIAAPWRDYTNNANDLVAILKEKYEVATGLDWDPNITRNMRGYYAFSWWRYEHAVHPMTTSAIVETGFLTNFSDRQLLVNSPEVPADAIANGIVKYLVEKKLL